MSSLKTCSSCSGFIPGQASTCPNCDTAVPGSLLLSGPMRRIGGAFIGGAIGESLDKVDKLHAKRAQSQALAAPIGQPISWRNPDSGNSGAVVATREGTNRASGAYCREYQTTITVDGQNQTAFGTACRQPDGAWKMF